MDLRVCGSGFVESATALSVSNFGSISREFDSSTAEHFRIYVGLHENTVLRRKKCPGLM